MRKAKTALEAIKVIKNWPLYFRDYFKLVRGKYIFYKLRNGTVFKIRPKTNDRVFFNEIWLSCSYVPPGFEINRSDLVLDIGAHIGFFSVFAALRAKEGHVYSFEPAPANFEMLQENIRLNGIKNITPINKAISQKGGTREFIIYPNSISTGAHSFAYSENRNLKITVQTISLDEFVKNHGIQKIDFLKMDCEEAEYEILFNSSHETLSMINKISMEYHDMDSTRNVTRLKTFLEQKGFKIKVNTSGASMMYAVRVENDD